MKKILLILSGIYPTIGGGDIYNDYLINLIEKDGHSIDACIVEPILMKHRQIAKNFYKNVNLHFIEIKPLKIPFNLLNHKINWLYRTWKAKKELKKFNLDDYDLIIDQTIFNFKELRKNKKAFLVLHTSIDYLNTQWKAVKSKNLFLYLYKILLSLAIKPLKLSMSYKFYQNIIVASTETKNYMEKYEKLQHNCKIYVIENGSISNKFKDKYNPNNGILSILRFDNLTKNLVFLNQVSANLDNKINVYGFGKDELMLKNVILNGKIVEREKIFETIQNYSLFIMTSNVEGGVPYSVIESLSVGVPVIIRDAFLGASNLVINGYNGLIFDKNTSPKEVAIEVQKLLNDKNKLVAMSRNSIIHFNKFFTIEDFNKKWRKIIDSV